MRRRKKPGVLHLAGLSAGRLFSSRTMVALLVYLTLALIIGPALRSALT